MTSAGKTSTDIHMVLDIVDVLQAKTHYDEFIVFSADADFTPVLRKLRREDRRTTMFAAGATSASYDACADLIIDPEAFIHEALGFDEEELVPAPPAPSEDSMLVQAEALVWAMVDDADQPVPLPALTKALATRIPALPATDWAGKGTFIALLRSLPLDPLRIDRELNAILDPRRLQNAPAHPSPPTRAPQQAGTGPIRGLRRPLWSRSRSGEEVAASDRPVPIARLAQIARARRDRRILAWAWQLEEAAGVPESGRDQNRVASTGGLGAGPRSPCPPDERCPDFERRGRVACQNRRFFACWMRSTCPCWIQAGTAPSSRRWRKPWTSSPTHCPWSPSPCATIASSWVFRSAGSSACDCCAHWSSMASIRRRLPMDSMTWWPRPAG
jgi:antitoxin (DNA-binding transcriptional repressor) of toxin-antitoxin stability system